MAGEILPASETVSAHIPKYKRITEQQLRTLLALSRAGKTQVEISQVLGCTQGTVSRWLDQFQDTRDEATQYLRSKALPMAMNVARRGRPDVQLKALQGLGVAAETEQNRGVTIVVGGSAQVQVNVGINASVTTEDR